MLITPLEMVSFAFHFKAKRGRNGGETRNELETRYETENSVPSNSFQPNLAAERSFAFIASVSRSRGGAVVTSESISLSAAAETRSTAS